MIGFLRFLLIWSLLYL